MATEGRKRRYMDFCAICGFPLDDVFPKHYPKEWMFCCGCLDWAELIAKKDPILQTKQLKENAFLKKVYNRITL